LNVGVFFNARRRQGGLYQYAATLVHCLRTYESGNRYVLFHAAPESLPLSVEGERWRVVRLPDRDMWPRLGAEAALFGLARLGWRRPLPVLPPYSEMRSEALDVMLYVKPSIHSFLWPFASVFPIHDLQHLFQPEFPEVAGHGESARREFLYRNAVPRAGAILADSDIGREDIIGAYAPDPSRVHALPHLAPTYLRAEVGDADLERVRRRYEAPERYLFYPAAFWPHKNHARLLKALAVLRDRHGVRLPLLLAGRRDREYPALAALATDLGLTGQVRFPGYVPDEDVSALYRGALALVMPTFFGPTNIPYLEAWSLGCPVITSNVRGLPEQVGDAGLLVDPRDEAALAEAIWRVHSDGPLRRALVERGRRRVAEWTPERFTARLAGILAAAAAPRAPR
jgi:glycosyltransferase involved in cell wall biosynthesis